MIKRLPQLTASAIALLTVVPLVVICATVFQADPAIWQHIWQYLMLELLGNTALLILGVTFGVTVIGVSLAWLTSACNFPGRGFFDWALLLPLAIPAYITGYVWIALFDFTGVVSTWLRMQFGIIHIPPIRSGGGLVLAMVLSLYPYVYLSARASFKLQGLRLIEAAQALGYSRRQAFFKVALPMARPAIVAGVVLALMETLADFGTVSVFNFNTFTTAIYKAWFGMFSLPAAAQLACCLVALVFCAQLIEQYMRPASLGTTRHSTKSMRVKRIELKGKTAAWATAWASSVFVVGFALPFCLLLVWASQVLHTDLDARYGSYVWHSVLLSSLGAACVMVLALLLAYALRLRASGSMRIVSRIATLGYALPGAVLAVGIFIPIAWLDGQLKDYLPQHSWMLSGTIGVMLLAYCARFLAVGFGPAETGLQQLSRSVDEASVSLGVYGTKRLLKVHIPLLRIPLLTGFALVFVDIMKELPITLMTRPFGWDTLAVRVFEMTSEGEWQRAALPSVAIALAGMIPIIILIRKADHADPR